MRIGLDFDGTVALYDEIFYRCAVEQYQMPAGVERNKQAVRAWFWKTPEGKQRWIELQGLVYGSRMNEARPAPGLERFLITCREKNFHLSLISHKTEFPVLGPRVNLREAARRWLEQNHFYEIGLRREDVFFESSREEKIQRIVSQRCSRFIDDLEEVFFEPAFPAHVEKVLYAPGRADRLSGDIKVFSSWDSIRNYFD